MGRDRPHARARIEMHSEKQINIGVCDRPHARARIEIEYVATAEKLTPTALTRGRELKYAV